MFSRVFEPTVGQNCKMRLWYHMYGKHVHKLVVGYRTGSVVALQPDNALWMKEGAVGNVWERASFSVNIRTKFQVS